MRGTGTKNTGAACLPRGGCAANVNLESIVHISTNEQET